MECIICDWKGDKRCYAQHIKSKTHELKKQIHEMESEVDEYSEFQLAMKMNREGTQTYVESKVKRMTKEEKEAFILATLMKKSTTELKVRIYEKTLFNVD